MNSMNFDRAAAIERIYQELRSKRTRQLRMSQLLEKYVPHIATCNASNAQLAAILRELDGEEK